MILGITQFLHHTFVATTSSFILAASQKSTSILTVTILGLQNQNSQICLRVYASEQGFPLNDQSEVHSQCTETARYSTTIKIPNLKPGTYAVSVIDDRNRDYQLNRDILGIPQEGFGISNNPQVSVATGLPKFQDASFLLRENQTIDITMKYSLDS
jgi:uncharacterized protein (DUF2141 family)